LGTRRKVQYIDRAPDSAFFEEKGPSAGEKKRWRAITPFAAACLMLLAFALLVFLNTYLAPSESIRQAVVSRTEMQPPLEVVAQWRPEGYVVLVFSSASDNDGYVERWTVAASGQAALQNTIFNDPRSTYSFLRFVGYGGIVLCLLAMVSIVRDRKSRATVVRRDHYTPPEFGPR